MRGRATRTGSGGSQVDPVATDQTPGDVKKGIFVRIRVVSIAVAAAVLAGLSGCAALGLGSTPVPAAFTATPAASVSPKPLPTRPGVPTPKPKTPAPALKNTGAAWPAILASLSGYGQWLIANPDPALIGNVAAPGCAVSDELGVQLSALLNENAYVQTSPVAITFVLGPSPAVGGRATLDVTAARAAEPVLSRAAKVAVTTYNAVPPTNLRIGLSQGADRRWRLCTVQSYADSGTSDDPSIPLI